MTQVLQSGDATESRLWFETQVGGTSLFPAGILFGIVFTTSNPDLRPLILAGLGLMVFGSIWLGAPQDRSPEAHNMRLVGLLFALFGIASTVAIMTGIV